MGETDTGIHTEKKRERETETETCTSRNIFFFNWYINGSKNGEKGPSISPINNNSSSSFFPQSHLSSPFFFPTPRRAAHLRSALPLPLQRSLCQLRKGICTSTACRGTRQIPDRSRCGIQEDGWVGGGVAIDSLMW